MTPISSFLGSCRTECEFLIPMGFVETEYERASWGESLVLASTSASVRLHMEWPRDSLFMATLSPAFDGRVPPYPAFETGASLQVSLTELLELRGDPDPARIQRGPTSRRDIPARVAENARALRDFARPELSGDFLSVVEIENRRRVGAGDRGPRSGGRAVKVRVLAPPSFRWETLAVLSALSYLKLSEMSEGLFDAELSQFAISIQPADGAQNDLDDAVSVQFGMAKPLRGFMIDRDASAEDAGRLLEDAVSRIHAPVVAVWRSAGAGAESTAYGEEPPRRHRT